MCERNLPIGTSGISQFFRVAKTASADEGAESCSEMGYLRYGIIQYYT